ncbi:MAG TPA: transposase [Methylomirabilota bacterium]|nr:transposase [Methylomirabilota bacterium]
MTTLDTPTSTSLRAARCLTLPQPPPTTQIENNDRSRVAAAMSPAQAVQVAARAISRNALHPVCSPATGVAFHPRALLAVLTYCYASEVFSSDDIEDLMLRDANFRAFCGNQVPDARTLRRFRRYNREAIETCLSAVLRALAEQSGTHPTDAEVFEQAHRKLANAVLMDMPEI